MSDSPSNPREPTHDTVEMLLCPKCRRRYQMGELICPHCGFALSRTGQTRLIASDEAIASPVNRPLYAGLVATPKPITFEIGDEKIVLPLEGQLVVGRISASNPVQPDVDLNPYGAEEAGVSRCHIQISHNGPLVYVTDLGSLNGTRINGTALASQVARLLRDGDKLEIAGLKITVRF